MNYQDAIKKSMEMFSEDEKTIFIGYNIINGSEALIASDNLLVIVTTIKSGAVERISIASANIKQ